MVSMRLATSIILFFVVVTIHAQVKLSGKVTASDTHKLIVAANVYISNTSIGSITNEKGEFSITHYPAGSFDLVVSYIGYKTYKIQVEANKIPATLDIVLQPKIVELAEVVVESYDKDGWNKWGQLFIENFIGTSAFESDCTLQNKEVLRFRLNKKTNEIRVVADDRILIENKALGYLLKYDMAFFEYNLTTRVFAYKGYAFFEELETDNKRKENRWTENRKEAYFGSLTHFMRSVFRNKLLEEGFEVRKMIAVSDQEIKRVKKISPALSAKTINKKATGIDSSDTRNADSTDYYRKVLNLSGPASVVLDKPLTGDNIAFAVDSVTCGFDFDTHLNIIYRPKKNPVEYVKFIPRSLAYTPVSSEIYRTSDKLIRILANGCFYEGSNLMTVGYWSWWEKMCNKLPYEYVPAPKN